MVATAAHSLCAKEGKTSAATSSGSVGTLNRDSDLRVVTVLKLGSLTCQTGPGPKNDQINLFCFCREE